MARARSTARCEVARTDRDRSRAPSVPCVTSRASVEARRHAERAHGRLVGDARERAAQTCAASRLRGVLVLLVAGVGRVGIDDEREVVGDVAPDRELRRRGVEAGLARERDARIERQPRGDPDHRAGRALAASRDRAAAAAPRAARAACCRVDRGARLRAARSSPAGAERDELVAIRVARRASSLASRAGSASPPARCRRRTPRARSDRAFASGEPCTAIGSARQVRIGAELTRAPASRASPTTGFARSRARSISTISLRALGQQREQRARRAVDDVAAVAVARGRRAARRTPHATTRAATRARASCERVVERRDHARHVLRRDATETRMQFGRPHAAIGRTITPMRSSLS